MKFKTSRCAVSVVAPAYRNPVQVAALLASLDRRCRGCDYEILVVDDGSPGHEIAQTCRGHHRTRVIRLAKNSGAATARNAGARAARAPIVLFVDSDAEATSDLVRWARQALHDPAYGAVIGAPHPVPLNPGFFSDFWALVKAECLPQDREAGSFYPAIGAIRRDLFFRLGGFDQKFQGASVEDFEFSQRLKEAGVRTCFEPRLVVKFAYPGIFRNLRQSFSRAGKWMVLRWGKVSFDRHTTTLRQAAAMMAGAAILPVMVAALAGWIPWAAAAGGVLVYGAVIWPFLAFCCRHRGWFYLPVAAFLQALVATVVILGVARAVWWRLTNVGSPEIFLAPRDA